MVSVFCSGPRGSAPGQRRGFPRFAASPVSASCNAVLLWLQWRVFRGVLRSVSRLLGGAVAGVLVRRSACGGRLPGGCSGLGECALRLLFPGSLLMRSRLR